MKFFYEYLGMSQPAVEKITGIPQTLVDVTRELVGRNIEVPVVNAIHPVDYRKFYPDHMIADMERYEGDFLRKYNFSLNEVQHV